MADAHLAFCLFDTAFGRCGIAWSERGLAGLQLPEADAGATRARMQRRGAVEAEPSPAVSEAIELLRAYFAGAETGFVNLALDLPESVGPERRRIYDVARSLGWGVTATYGDVAKRAGMPGGARVVGQAMATNPLPIIIPCHRVLASGGRIGGFSAFGGAVTKERLLALEKLRLDL